MAGRIPQEFIDELVARTDIVELIDSRVPLKKAGREYTACCPFHNEKTPSFTVSPTKQFYHCFGCGAHGTAIGFLMEFEHMEFPEAVEELARRAIDAYGKVHVLCNNAGVSGELCYIWQASYKDWDWTMGVNFWGVVHGLKAFVPHMLEHGEEAHIVNTASIAGLGHGWGIYGVTKHAVVAMTESLSMQLQLIGARIGVSVLCPSAVDTNIPTSRRNRPAALTNDPADPASAVPEPMRRYRERMNAALKEGKQPAEVADIVLEAIRNNDFYILTHPDQQEPRVRARAETIVGRKAPAPPAFVLGEEWRLP